MEDYEIAKSVKLLPITKIAQQIGIQEDELEMYGKDKAKICKDASSPKKNAKLVLVTAINPTPLGEGKTTISIGLADGLRRIGKNSVLALREPSLGPVFGIKGGATGGGYAQIAPMEDINLHFTGDIHAITSANNLLSALIDNHIYFGNALNIKKVTWKRCMDLNDRQLRKIQCGLSEEKAIVPREDGFDITVASEIMAILCLATDLADLKRRLGNIIIGYNEKEEPIYAKDLKAQGSMAVLLKDAMKPNLVQTLEHTPALVHGGPFANIAHGCNSIIATKMALTLGDYVVTEAGFGADLGAEKFIHIKCQKANLKPDCVVCVATMKALKYHGEAQDYTKKDITALQKGMKNLFKHIANIHQFGLPVIVAINKYQNDEQEEIDILSKCLEEKQIQFSLVEVWEKGGQGAIDLAQKVEYCCQEESSLTMAYDIQDTICNKIEAIATKIYGAQGVEYTQQSLEQIAKIEKMGRDKMPVCIAKTQYSFSDDPKKLNLDEPFKIHVEEVLLKNGAEFIVVRTGKIFTMPGLPKVPASEKIDLDEQENIVGIF